MTDDIRVKIHNDLIIKDIERETNYAINCDYDFVNLNIDDVKVLLENCKKQSKEIEELKEVKWYYEISRVPKDKIKATIEEVDKDENASIPDFMEYAKEYAKGKLQSLLEKE